MTYQIVVNGQVEKSYNSKYVAFIWCLMHGYVAGRRGDKWLVGNVEIKEVKE